MATRKAGAIVALALMTGLAVTAQTANVSGDWTFSVETGMGAGSPAVSFTQDGEKITGSYNGQLGNTTFTGTLKGSAIEFSFTTEAQGQTVDVVYTGTTDGTTMKGKVAIAGGQLTGTFTGKKK